jgi:TrmH family RNA methyltransferase
MKNLCAVLVGTRNPLNVGAVARAMSNFGAMELRAVRPYEKAWREAKSAVGAGELLARAKEFANLAEAVADCSLVVGTTAVGNREMKHPLRRLEEGARLMGKRMETGRVAVLFGSEKWGLSNEDLSYCHWLMRIPTRVEHRSMNLGQAAAVVMYELGRRERITAEDAEKRGKTRALETEGCGTREGNEGRVCGHGDSGADWGGFAGGAAKERIHRCARRGEGGGEVAADAAQIFAGDRRRGSILGYGEEDIVEA